MRTLLQTAGNSAAPTLLALLSGSYSEPEDFVGAGFPAALREHAVHADVAMVGMRAAWFADGTVVNRIRESVVAPAKARGNTSIWLAGISLGGLAALSYAARHEEDVSGILLISPYPATRDVLREVDAAGGLEHWKPAIPPGGDLEREAWLWLSTRARARTPVYCYFASGDRFAPGQRRMAATLDPGHVLEIPGGHDWAAWSVLWREFLARHKASLQGGARYHSPG